MMKKIRTRGLSLVELMIGGAIILFILSATIISLQTLSKGNTSNRLKSYVEQDINVVYESLRYLAGVEWDNMTETDVLKDQAPHYPTIKIFSTVYPIDVLKKSRAVSLRAEWHENGIPKSSTSTFTLIYTRVKLKGGVVVIKFRDRFTLAPVPGIQVSAMGEDGFLQRQSGANGECRLDGIEISDTGVDLTINTGSTRYYFAANYPPTWPFAGESRILRSPATRPYPNVTEFPYEIDLNPPGRLSGKVLDDATDAGVVDAKVYLLGAASKLAYGTGARLEATTDSNGDFSFNDLIPGSYSLVLMPSRIPTGREYAGLGVPRDSTVNKRTFISVNSGLLSSGHVLRTLKRGSVNGRVTSAWFDGAEYCWDESLTYSFSPFPYKLNLRYDESRTYADMGATQIGFSFSQSETWLRYDALQRSYGKFIVDSDSSANFRFTYFAPTILHSSVTYPLANQYGIVMPRPFWCTPPGSDLTPIMVFNLDESTWMQFTEQTQFIIVGRDTALGTDYELVAPVSSAVDLSRAALRIYANTESTFEMRLLNQNSLSNVAGHLYLEGSVNTPFEFDGEAPANISSSYVETIWGGLGGFGYLTFEGIDGGAMIRKYYRRNTNMPTSAGGEHTYDMMGPAGPNSPGNAPYLALPPNVGADVTYLHYYAQTGTMTSTNPASFYGRIRGYTKRFESGADKVVYGIVDPYTYDPIGFKATLGTTKYWEEYVALSAISGSPATDAQFDLTSAYPYTKTWDSNAYVQLRPYNTVGTQEMNFPVPSGQTNNLELRLKFSAVNEDDPTWVFLRTKNYLRWIGGRYEACTDTPGDPVKLVKKAKTGRIYGRIRDNGGNVLKGSPLTVRLRVTHWKNSYRTTDYIATANACPTCPNVNAPNDVFRAGDTNYQFVFNEIPFLPREGSNLRLEVLNAPALGYQNAVSESVEGYEGINWQADFMLQKQPATAPEGNL